MIRKAKESDINTIVDLACHLWDGHTVEHLTHEYTGVLQNDDTAIFIIDSEGVSVGFAQCQLRHDYVEGTESSPVGYLEGIYIRDDYRRRGFAAELLNACENWAAEKGCSEFASDCEIGNTDSFFFHIASGFEEANRVICFYKKLK